MGSAVYALLVRILFPRRVRDRIGADLIACHAEVMGRATGPLDRTRRWIREVGDLVAAAWRVRIGGSAAASPTPKPGPGRASLGAGGSWTASLADDLVHALRSLVRSPGSTAFVILVMGGGLGATTAVYSVIRHTLLHPLPYAASDRMVTLWRTIGNAGSMITTTPEQAELWGGQEDLVEGVIRMGSGRFTLSGQGDPEALYGARINPDYFAVLGVRLAFGRSFVPEEHVEGGPRSLVLGHGTWIRRFGADRDVLGTTVTLDGEPWTVVGVGPERAPLPTGFPDDPAVYLPLRPDDTAPSTVAVLREGVTLEAYRARIDSLVARAAAESGEPARYGGTAVRPSQMTGGRIRRSLTLVAVAVGVLLLIACLNVSALLVNRSDRRRHETAVRVALGVGRGRLLRQHFLESAMLAATAGLLGLGVGLGGIELTRLLRPDDLQVLDRVRLDAPVATFGLAVALATGLLFGLLPALQAGSARGLGVLRGGVRGGRDDRAGRRARWLLVVGEVALSFALLVGSALLVRTMASLQELDVGFEPRGLAVVQLDLPDWKYPEAAEHRVVIEAMKGAVARAPRVAAVAASSGMATRPGVWFGKLEVEGRALSDEEASMPFFGSAVDPDFFDVVGQPILEGRAFTEAEAEDGADVYVLGESTAADLFPEGDPVGRRMRIGDRDWSTVVGVVADVPMTSMDMDDSSRKRQLYQPRRAGATLLLVRARGGDASAAMPGIRAAVRSVVPETPMELTDAVSMLGRSVSVQRFTMRLLVALGALAVLLAGLGLYGVVAQTVGRRTREIGIRMSLGARTGEIVWMVLRSGGVAVALGMALGIGLSLAGGRIIESQLVVVEPGDLPSYLGAAAVLALAAGVAVLLPARRAARVDPVRAIATE